jgi:L,D-transpeptidase catalytic domain
MHGAPYVSEASVRKLGRLGRSWGCPAVRASVARPLIDDLKDGQYVFAYYPDAEWLQRSALLSCKTDRTVVAANSGPASNRRRDSM